MTRSIPRAIAIARVTFGGERRLLATTALGLGVSCVCGVVIAKLLDDVMGGDDTATIDPQVLDLVIRHRSAGRTAVARTITHLADPWVIAAVTAAAVVSLCVSRLPRLAMLVAASTLGASLATTAAKYAVDRPRPPASLWLGAASGPAFPSGHATQSIACYGALAVTGLVVVDGRLMRLAFVAVAVIIAIGVGASRVYLAVHWPSDVACGWAVAALWLVTLLLIGWARPRFITAWADRPPDRPHANAA